MSKNGIELVTRFSNHLKALWQRIYAENGIVSVEDVIEQNELLTSYETLRNRCLKGHIIRVLHRLNTLLDYHSHLIRKINK